MGKMAVVYYSLTGNCDYVAARISKNLDVDLIKITPKKEYPNSGFRKFFWGGKSAVMGDAPELESYKFDGDKYDHIIFGTPVWASSFTPPIRTFINENKSSLLNKKISCFVCFSGGGAEKVIEKLIKYLGIDSLYNKLILIDPKDKESNNKIKEIDDFCAKFNK